MSLELIGGDDLLRHGHVSTGLTEVERVPITIRSEWTLLAIGIHGINSRQEAASVRIEEAVSCQLDLGPIDVLHSLELTVKQVLLNVRVLELTENGDIDEVQLLLDAHVLIVEFLLLSHAFLQMLSQSLQVNIEVSLDWSQLFNDYLFDHSSAEVIDFD